MLWVTADQVSLGFRGAGVGAAIMAASPVRVVTVAAVAVVAAIVAAGAATDRGPSAT